MTTDSRARLLILASGLVMGMASAMMVKAGAMAPVLIG